MPRKRVVDPRFFKDWELFEAEQKAGLPLRLAYEGLWAVADREGRFSWKPREIKLDVLPFDEVDFGAVMEALSAARFICHYEVEGKGYGYIPNFKRYQPIHPREAASTIPPPPGEGLPSPGQGLPKASLVTGGDDPSPPASTSTSTPASASTSEDSVLSEPADAAPKNNGRAAHSLNSCLGLVVERLYFGNRPSRQEMTTNGSILKAFHAKGHSFDRLAHAIDGLAERRDRGELGNVGTRQAVSLKWLNDKDQILNQIAVSEDVYYRSGPDPPEGKRGGVSGIGAVLTSMGGKG